MFYAVFLISIGNVSAFFFKLEGVCVIYRKLKREVNEIFQIIKFKIIEILLLLTFKRYRFEFCFKPLNSLDRF